MDRLTFCFRNEHVNLDVEKIKFVLGNNFDLKYELFKVINIVKEKYLNSEYAKENNLKYELKFNEEAMATSDFDFNIISTYFNMNNDLKNTAKSITANLFSNLLKDIEYSENYQTLSIVYNDLIDYLNDKLGEETEKRLSIDSELTVKTLAKMLNLTFLEDDLSLSYNDLSLKDNIMFQLKMYEIIAKNSNKRNLCLLNIPYVDLEIYDKIKQINSMFIVITNKIINIDVPAKDILILDDFIIDLADDEKMYEVTMDYKENITIDELRLKLKESFC